ncbi:MAG: thiamine pyrophosphate-dependent dehydrogenase E1 component subunit alpha [Chloroflexota bacterium]
MRLVVQPEAADQDIGVSAVGESLDAAQVRAGEVNRGLFYARLYRSLYRVRRVEEEIARIYPTDKIKSPVHLSIGQEAVSVGVCEALQRTDVVFGTYRGHALYLAKGGDLDRMIAELYGKVTGCASGKGGSMHLVDTSCGMMGTSAVVGTTISNAVGYAYAVRYRNESTVVASFFGDGAVEEGAFWESLNFAALKRLPILFVCENNGYAIHTEQAKRQATLNLVDRIRAFGVPAHRIEANDVLRIYELTAQSIAALRSGVSGPVFLECMTSRWREHVGPNEDFQLGYRASDEVLPWMKHDQVRRLRGELGMDSRQEIEVEVEGEIRAAFAFAERSPFPDPSQLHADLFRDA